MSEQLRDQSQAALTFDEWWADRYPDDAAPWTVEANKELLRTAWIDGYGRGFRDGLQQVVMRRD